jgi:hypothetical protein
MQKAVRAELAKRIQVREARRHPPFLITNPPPIMLSVAAVVTRVLVALHRFLDLSTLGTPDLDGTRTMIR